MNFFKYGQTELNALKKKDKKLSLAIDHIGMIRREVIPDLFAALVNSIIGQQISMKAAATVWNRLLESLGEITPESIFNASIEKIKQCGMSIRKAGYIKNAAEAVTSGKLDISALTSLPDNEVINNLCSLNGIGVWTAEMLMIFSMERPDIVSWGDSGIRRGMMNLYGLKELTKTQFDSYRKRYSPYGTVASFYLWELSFDK